MIETPTTIEGWQQWIGDWAKRKGWDQDSGDIPLKLVLMHSEISEALEEHRKGHSPQHVYISENDKPEGIGVELADLVIRVLHFCHDHNIDLSKLIALKMGYNEARPHRHGKTC